MSKQLSFFSVVNSTKYIYTDFKNYIHLVNSNIFIDWGISNRPLKLISVSYGQMVITDNRYMEPSKREVLTSNSNISS